MRQGGPLAPLAMWPGPCIFLVKDYPMNMEIAMDHDSASPRRVLIVEDEVLIALMLQDMLADAGLQVEAVANSLDTGIDLARNAAVDLAVLDINLNGEDVYPIAEILRGRGIPFIFSTGYGAGGVRPEFDAAPRVVKPFQQDLLVAALRQLVK
ncbi:MULTISPECIES: response regulator [Rhodomicrobium]|uniref:response regulator n=1 Tax=Rhodomicrobium TaxID=1068 RepID=UPI001FD98C07|nr:MULTISPECIES: response regulator [Rhodomicrobium]